MRYFLSTTLALLFIFSAQAKASELQFPYIDSYFELGKIAPGYLGVCRLRVVNYSDEDITGIWFNEFAEPFHLYENRCGNKLEAKKSCSFQIAFLPGDYIRGDEVREDTITLNYAYHGVVKTVELDIHAEIIPKPTHDYDDSYLCMNER